MSQHDTGLTVVTGARGHIGQAVCAAFHIAGINFLPTDLAGAATAIHIVPCDLTSPDQIAHLFQSHPIRAVVHLAGILPTAFLADPLLGAETNLTASVSLLRAAVRHHVRRFVFASSMSVYGSSATPRLVSEDHPAAPDHPYGAAKRAIELIGEQLASIGNFEFVSLRIARVVGPGIQKTSSPWRAQIFAPPDPGTTISIPFAPDVPLSLIHVDDLAQVILTLAATPKLIHSVYNTPAEAWEAAQLQHLLQTTRGLRVQLGPATEARFGPICDGRRFATEFQFRPRSLADRLSSPTVAGSLCPSP